MPRIKTFGHGTLTQEEFTSLMKNTEVDAVLDIRRYPGSRKHPQFMRDDMARWVPSAGIAYSWLEHLGGRRKPDASSPHVGLRNLQFRAYADYMQTPEFSHAVDSLLSEASSHAIAVMCSESVWWRCHRRLLADYLVLIRQVEVLHIFHDSRLTPHPVTPGAIVDADRVLYLSEERSAENN